MDFLMFEFYKVVAAIRIINISDFDKSSSSLKFKLDVIYPTQFLNLPFVVVMTSTFDYYY